MRSDKEVRIRGTSQGERAANHSDEWTDNFVFFDPGKPIPKVLADQGQDFTDQLGHELTHAYQDYLQPEPEADLNRQVSVRPGGSPISWAEVGAMRVQNRIAESRGQKPILKYWDYVIPDPDKPYLRDCNCDEMWDGLAKGWAPPPPKAP